MWKEQVLISGFALFLTRHVYLRRIRVPPSVGETALFSAGLLSQSRGSFNIRGVGC